MWSPHERGCALDGPVLGTTQRIGDQRQSQTMFIGRLLCGARISERPSTEGVGLLDADTNKSCSIVSSVCSLRGHGRVRLLTRALEHRPALGI